MILMKKLKELKRKISENKALNIILGIIKFIIYAFLILLLVTILVQKISQNKKTIGGFMVFTVASESMVPEYKVGNILFTKKVPEEDLKVREELLKVSIDYPLYAITDGSYIFDDGKAQTIYRHEPAG